MTGGAEHKFLQQAAGDVAHLQGDCYYGHLVCPRENLVLLQEMGVLVAASMCEPGSLFARALVCVPAPVFSELASAELVSPTGWFMREGSDIGSIAQDLSKRDSHALQSDLIFCRWHLAVRNCHSSCFKTPPLHGQAEFRFRIFDAPIDEVRFLEAELLRVAKEIRRRGLFIND